MTETEVGHEQTRRLKAVGKLTQKDTHNTLWETLHLEQPYSTFFPRAENIII